MRTVILWFRRDLRLTDNPALLAALRDAEAIIPVFIWAPEEEAPWAPGRAARAWIGRSLPALDAALRERGSRLLLRSGSSAAALLALARETGAAALVWNRLQEPAALARDRALQAELEAAGLTVDTFNAALLIEPGQLLTGSGQPYRMFSPFCRSLWERLPGWLQPQPAPERIPAPAAWPASLSLEATGLPPDAMPAPVLHRPGEAGAWAALDRFCEEAAEGYRSERDVPAQAGTSRLSPHLHHGEIGPRQVLARVQRELAPGANARRAAGLEQFRRELAWREFAAHLLFHFPDSAERPLNPRFADFPWRWPADYAADLAAWQQGRTGIPLVDAGQRELLATGWMHNRIRMVTASFLTKNLLIPWQEGARWFWEQLLDADLANNSLGWQWVAGCGVDAAPYFRVFNPVLQSQKFDPRGEYLRRWLPELRELPERALHAPWLQSPPPAGYPPPRVDLGASRARALAAYGGDPAPAAPPSPSAPGRGRRKPAGPRS